MFTVKQMIVHYKVNAFLQVIEYSADTCSLAPNLSNGHNYRQLR